MIVSIKNIIANTVAKFLLIDKLAGYCTDVTKKIFIGYI